MRYGAVVCVSSDEARPRRTFGYFSRADRELSQSELEELEARLEQLCRYITRPALSDERVQLNGAGQVEL